VIASSEPLDSEVDSDRYASVQGDLLEREFRGYVQESFGPTQVFGDRPGYMRHFRWTPEDGTPITQLQLYFADNGRGFTATATTTTSTFESAEAVLRTVLASLVVGGGSDQAAT
jgi:hypothetical protein